MTQSRLLRRMLASLTGLLLLRLGGVSALATDRFVSLAGNDTANDCSISSSPCQTVAQAIAQSTSGDTIKVAAGQFDGLGLGAPGNPKAIAFSTTLVFSGGWTSDFSARDPSVNVTGITGHSLCLDSGARRPNFFTCGDSNDPGPLDITIDGFTLVNSDLRVIAHDGGSVTLTIANSIVTKNACGTLRMDAGQPSNPSINADQGTATLTVVNSLFTKNSDACAGGPGAAVTIFSSYSGSATGSFVGTTFTKNKSTKTHFGGGAIGLDSSGTSKSHLILSDSTFSGNVTQSEGQDCGLLFCAFDGYGGAIVARQGDASTLTISATHTSFLKNKAGRRGGAIYLGGGGGASMQLSDVTMQGNSGGSGGGIAIEGDVDAQIVNSIVAANKAKKFGGGILAASSGTSSLAVTNSDVTANKATFGGGIEAESHGGGTDTVRLTNAIVWKNSISGKGNGGDLRAIQVQPTLVVDLDHSDVGDRFNSGATLNDLGGNIDVDPLFVSAKKNFHLKPGSPCIDAGTCTGAPPTDFEGNPRPTGASCDIGADEFVP